MGGDEVLRTGRPFAPWTHMVSFPGPPGVIVDVVVCSQRPWGLGPQYSLGIRAFCICSQGPWGLGPQFCLGTRSIMLRLFPGGAWALGPWWENLSVPMLLCMILNGSLSTSSSTPFLSLNLCVVFISWVGSINNNKTEKTQQSKAKSRI